MFNRLHFPITISIVYTLKHALEADQQASGHNYISAAMTLKKS